MGASRRAPNQLLILSCRSMAWVGLITLPTSVAHAANWFATDATHAYTIRSEGDPLSVLGASIVIDSSNRETQNAGASTTIAPDELIQKFAVLSGELTQTGGKGGAIAWIRADGDSGPLAFANSQQSPVTGSAGTRVRVLELYIPLGTTKVSFGISVVGQGTASASHLRLSTRNPAPQTGAKPNEILNQAIRVIKNEALNASKINWPALENELYGQSARATYSGDIYPLIKKMLRGLNDGHSFFLDPVSAKAYHADVNSTTIPTIEVHDEVGYIKLPSLNSSNKNVGERYENVILKGVAESNAKGHCGWIIDLRENEGGNMWPMLSALRLFLGDYPFGSFRDKNDSASQWKDSSELKRPTTTYASSLLNIPIALIIGSHTASAAEMVAIAFKGRTNVRYFGAASAGQTSANQEIDLPDGSQIYLATSRVYDRLGNEYLGPIEPDERVRESTIDADFPKIAARRWILTTAHCATQ